MKYEDFKVKNLKDIEELLNANEIEAIVKGIVNLKYCDNDKEIERVVKKLFEFVRHENFWIAKNAITTLSELYKNNEKINIQEILNLFETISRPELKPYIREAIEDINIFNCLKINDAK